MAVWPSTPLSQWLSSVSRKTSDLSVCLLVDWFLESVFWVGSSAWYHAELDAHGPGLLAEREPLDLIFAKVADPERSAMMQSNAVLRDVVNTGKLMGNSHNLNNNGSPDMMYMEDESLSSVFQSAYQSIVGTNQVPYNFFFPFFYALFSPREQLHRSVLCRLASLPCLQHLFSVPRYWIAPEFELLTIPFNYTLFHSS